MARRTRRRSARRRTPTPGWVWMMFGLAVGLSIAAAIHVKHRTEMASAPVAQPAPAAPAAGRAAPPAPARPESRFDFYELLPQFEVVVPETDAAVQPDRRPAAVDTPGSYVLQAGSFRRYEDADRMKANLALRGIESSIQRVQIDQDTFHRVRIGPIDDLQRLNQVRSQLRDAHIEVLLIRVPD